MNIIDIINTQSSWGRNQVKQLPMYGNEIAEVMTKLNKTNQSKAEVLYILYHIVCKEINYYSSNEFIEYMKLQKTMVNHEQAQEILRQYWSNTAQDLRSNPKLHSIVKQCIISINNTLTGNNSTRQMRIQFIEFFLAYALANRGDM